LVISKIRSLSRQTLLHGFVACAIPVHVWSIVNWLRDVEAWLLRFDVWETVVAVLFFLLLGVILPRSFFIDHFASQSAVTMLVATAWIAYFHLNFHIVTPLRWTSLLIWFLSLGFAILAANIALLRSKRLEAAVAEIVDRFTVLALIYVALDLVGVAIVLVRNI